MTDFHFNDLNKSLFHLNCLQRMFRGQEMYHSASFPHCSCMPHTLSYNVFERGGIGHIGECASGSANCSKGFHTLHRKGSRCASKRVWRSVHSWELFGICSLVSSCSTFLIGWWNKKTFDKLLWFPKFILKKKKKIKDFWQYDWIITSLVS